MVEKLTTNLIVELDSYDSESINQKWEADNFACPGLSRNYFTRCYKLYPLEAIAGIQVASFGTITFTGKYGQETRKEYIKFSNSNRANANYPINELNSAVLRFAFKTDGTELTDISFRLDEKTYELVASQPFYGAVHIEYVSKYGIFQYQPEVSVPAGSGYRAQYGNLISFYKNNIADTEVLPPQWGDNPIRFDLYRVTSNVLLNKYGNWETPLDWDTFQKGQKAWPQEPESPIKGGNGAENARVHEVGYYQPGSGLVHYDRAFLNWEAPKTGTTWTPQYTFAWQQSLSAAQGDQELLQTLQKINFDDITDRVKSTYPKIEGVVDFYTGRPA